METHTNTEHNNRLVYLDYIKALGISLVILYHCNYVPFESMLIRGIYAMCVPLFFAVNGFLMLRKEYSLHQLFKKNLKLLFVLFFWGFVSAFVYMICNSDFDAFNRGWLEKSKYLIFCTFTTKVPECDHLWFLKALFILNLLNPVFHRFVYNNKQGLLYLLVLMAIWSIDFFDIASAKFVNPFLHWMTAYSVLYYLVGYAVLTEQLPYRVSNRVNQLSFIIVSLFICMLSQWGYNWLLMEGPLLHLNQEKGWLVDIVWDNYNALFVVLMTAITILLFRNIKWKSNRFWSFVGKNSLAIYVLQTPVQRLLDHFSPLSHLAQGHHSFGLILPILTLLGSMGITWLLKTNRYTEFLITL